MVPGLLKYWWYREPVINVYIYIPLFILRKKLLVIWINMSQWSFLLTIWSIWGEVFEDIMTCDYEFLSGFCGVLENAARGWDEDAERMRCVWPLTFSFNEPSDHCSEAALDCV